MKITKCKKCGKLPQVYKIREGTWEFNCLCPSLLLTNFKTKQAAISHYNSIQVDDKEAIITIRLPADGTIVISTNAIDGCFEKINASRKSILKALKCFGK